MSAFVDVHGAGVGARAIRLGFAAPALATLAAGLLLACGCRSAAPREPGNTPGAVVQSNTQIEREVFRRINAYRRSRGLAPLHHDAALAAAARDHSRAMAARNRLSHSGFDRRFRRLQPAGFRGLAENVAMSVGLARPAEVAVAGWRRSAGHHKNIVSREHRCTGVGVSRGRDGSVYLCQLFGSR